MDSIYRFQGKDRRLMWIGAVICMLMGMTHWVLADDDRHRRGTSVNVQVNIGAPAANAVPSPASYVIENRGMVHEAFDEPVVFDPRAGIIVAKRPPAPIDEVPPSQYLQGDDVVWIPGYWGWDDDRSDFIWVSGIWRNMPPGRQFVPGYWCEVQGGCQWVSGFWQVDKVETVQYLPAPPESLEAGPVGVPPQPTYIWVPGVWVWRPTGYIWRAGSWIAPQENWVWVPDHYTWTPSGCVFVAGYWDHVVVRRGVLFAPIYVPSPVLARRTFVYTPSVVVNASLLVGNLFARPRYDHFYFGDYYDRAYFRSGIYPVVSFHNSRYGYDPCLARYVATQRIGQAAFTQSLRDEYHFRRDHQDARPPRTYDALQQLAARRDVNPHLAGQLAMAQPLSQMAKRSDLPFRFQSIPQDRVDKYRDTVTQTRHFQDQRKHIEVSKSTAAPTASISTPTNRVNEPRPVQTSDRPVQQPARVQPAPSRQQQTATPSAQTSSHVAKPVQPATPETVQRGPSQPTQLKLQRSPLVSRPRTFFDSRKPAPAQPKASTPDANIKPGTHVVNRREPQE